MVPKGSTPFPLRLISLGDPILGTLVNGPGEGERASEVRLEVELGFDTIAARRRRAWGTDDALMPTEAFPSALLPSTLSLVDTASVPSMAFFFALGLLPNATLLAEGFFSVFSSGFVSSGLLVSLLLSSDTVDDCLC